MICDMTTDVEREHKVTDQPLVKERPTDMEIPPELERGGTCSSRSQPVSGTSSR